LLRKRLCAKDTRDVSAQDRAKIEGGVREAEDATLSKVSPRLCQGVCLGLVRLAIQGILEGQKNMVLRNGRRQPGTQCVKPITELEVEPLVAQEASDSQDREAKVGEALP
jgi:hypothetical protein